ncbi:hypothetical protein A8C56_06030 [Niabella ginsenosidivorans]|uniref:Esterase n=1 Tax=Niabella ginsenosidivorans TaxID=1176587 RepID=A0A1A9I0J4_9BACT|nr:alpha/beta hydrolase-fold protein [Niabella ginsenosidivorans]ANH80599.1 hypothetical protein A8C56_06030 [Niabella ginsenosidivorans]
MKYRERKKSFFFTVACLCFFIAGRTQDLNKSFSIATLHSDILNEDREIYISLPPGYDDARYSAARYPVLYFFDGETSIGFYKAVTQFLSKGAYACMPEMILVGIKNKDRTRDLTPTKSFIRSPDDSTVRLFQNSGGNEHFIQFLAKELFPYISRHYRTDDYRIISGHSFGGLAASNILVHHAGLFNAYILMDPSIWWDNAYILRQARSLAPSKIRHKTKLYLAQANNKTKSASFDAGNDATEQFNNVVGACRIPFLEHKYKFYEQEDHGTIALPALYDALKFIFTGYEVDFKEISRQPDIIINSYKKFSESAGHTFIPSQQKLEQIIRFFKENKKYREAQIVYRQYKELYPGSKYTF